MRILLDTHIYLWGLQDNAKLSKSGRERIASASEVYVSSASIWEATIKAGIGKLDVDVDSLVEEIVNNGFLELVITAKHGNKLQGSYNSLEQQIMEFLRLIA